MRDGFMLYWSNRGVGECWLMTGHVLLPALYAMLLKDVDNSSFRCVDLKTGGKVSPVCPLG